MGNSSRKGLSVNQDSVDGVYSQTKELCQEFDNNLSARSFGSVSSHQSVYSVSRPWSRVSRRRWKESTLTLPYECSKTAWPVSQLESFFLPEFPLLPNQKKFENLGEISKGSFGKVYKVKDEGRVYALKILSKSKIIKENAVRQVKDEVQIQGVCGHHPYIVSSPSRWQSRKRLYIVSEYVSGGELYNLLKSYVVLPIELVRIYVAQLALAIDFLHNAGVIYRDLKPENVLLDEAGNVQLIDFGLSKWLSYGKTTRTICGTLLYMAPEVLGYEAYGHAADWWSLGVISCLMLTGKYPITETDSEEKKVVRLPVVDLDVSSRDLLLRLLEVEPAKRLKSLRKMEIIAFFKGFNLRQVVEGMISPREILEKHFPEGAPEKEEAEEEAVEFLNFEESFNTAL